MLAPVLSLAAVLLGLACIVGDHALGAVLLRRAGNPEAGATSLRVLGMVLFVAGGVAFLAWMPT
jgi:hypothetical protein